MADNYWADRYAASMQKLTTKNIKQTQTQLRKYYMTTMKRVIGDFENTYNKLLATAAAGKEFTPADLYKLDTYWQMQGQLQRELQKLGNRQAKILSKNFMVQFSEIYEALAIKNDLYFGKVDKSIAQQMISQIWCADGKTWSDRVWGNINKLQQTLNDGLIDCVVAGRKTTELKNILQERFTVSYSNAETIVRTEMAHIQTQAAQKRYEDAGITEVEVWADKDERRCDVCGKLHETRHPINGAMPIPAHPRCRCTIIPVVEENNQLVVISD